MVCVLTGGRASRQQCPTAGGHRQGHTQERQSLLLPHRLGQRGPALPHRPGGPAVSRWSPEEEDQGPPPAQSTGKAGREKERCWKPAICKPTQQ